ncbi:MAG: NADP-dependent oxidoreductase [Alphaproteobacteria bacterium]|jgi:NADPH-dependent curcumin reductase CurA
MQTTPSSGVTQFRLAKYPSGAGFEGIFARTEDALAEMKPGEVHLRLSHISVDPGMRGWITPKRSYMPPVQPGEVMRAFGVGEVVASRADGIAAGDWMSGFTGVQTEAVLPARMLRKIDPRLAPPRSYLSGLGMTGYTAYFGLLDVGRPAAKETVVVSAAAGAVGSIAGQIARLKGCHVIGIAGGEHKRQFLLNDLKLHGAIDYKSGPIGPQLAALAPNGVDVYFDNVGGEALDAVLSQINRRGRIVLCGGISQYGDMDHVRGPSNYLQMIAQSVTMQGFTMRDYMDRVPEAFMSLMQWQAAGEIIFREHVVKGIDAFPDALAMLFAGRNEGKLLIEL